MDDYEIAIKDTNIRIDVRKIQKIEWVQKQNKFKVIFKFLYGDHSYVEEYDTEKEAIERINKITELRNRYN